MSQVEVLALVSLALAVVGVVGVVVPVLPGSLLVGVALLVWALGVHSTLGWVTLAVGGAVVLGGSLAGTVLTRRRLSRREVPQWPVLAAVAGGIVGAFLLPGPGLLVGFVVTLLLVQLARVRRLREALATMGVALRAVGVGMLVELGCDLFATSALVVSVWYTLR